MSAPPAEDVVRDLTDNNEEEYLDQDDVLEVDEVIEEGDEHMDSDDGDHGEGEDTFAEGGDGEGEGEDEVDDAEAMLDQYDDAAGSFEVHEGAVFAVALHPVDDTLAVSGGEDDLAYLFRVPSGEVVAKLTGHSDSVTSVGWSHDGEMVATGGMDGRVRVWRRAKGDPSWSKWEFLTNLEGPDEVNWLDWHPKGNVLLAGGADGTVWIWNLPSGTTMQVLSGHITSVTCGRWTPDGKKVVTCSEDSTLILWDPRDGSVIHKLVRADGRFNLRDGINCLSINPTSTVAILGGAAGGIRAVSLTSGQVLAQMQGHVDGSSVEAVAYSEVPIQGAASVVVMVSVGTDGRVCTWEANTFKLRATGTHEDAVTSLAFSPGTTTFVTGSADKTLKIWDYRRGSCEKTLLGHRDVIHGCSVSKDGKVIISGGEDGAVKCFRPDEVESGGHQVAMEE